ncbi:MAG: TetR/AcrR family transcriptional regulator [Candidatus Kariarchaeaceae archaeon]|jgi:AcrR family transcriptional regulator
MVKYTLDQIIDAGRQSYFKQGADFTMSDVARELNTKASSLYRHVATKRELYFAMLTKEFSEFETVIEKIIAELVTPTPTAILQSVGRYILKMAREDNERFMLMFMTKPPEAGSKLQEESVGPHELTCNPQTIGFIQGLVKQHIHTNNLDPSLTTNLTFYLVSLVVGAGIVTSPTYEYSNQGLLSPGEYEAFHDFVIENSLSLWSQ